MKVSELIEALKDFPPGLEVRAWDAELDDWAIVSEAIYEDGTSAIDLITRPE